MSAHFFESSPRKVYDPPPTFFHFILFSSGQCSPLPDLKYTFHWTSGFLSLAKFCPHHVTVFQPGCWNPFLTQMVYVSHSLLSSSLKIYNKIPKTKNNRARVVVSICDTQWILAASLWTCFLIYPEGEEPLPGLNCLSELMRIKNRSERVRVRTVEQSLATALQASVKVLLNGADCQLLRYKYSHHGQCQDCNTHTTEK